MVCNCSVDPDDSIAYYLHFFNHAEMYYILEKTVFQYCNYYVFLFRCKQYIPVKLCKSTGSMHLFQIYGQLSSDQIVLEKNCLRDMIRINWKEVFVTFFEWHNGTDAKIS